MAARRPSTGDEDIVIGAAFEEAAVYVDGLANDDACILAIVLCWEQVDGFAAYTAGAWPMVWNHGLEGQSPRDLLVSLSAVAVKIFLAAHPGRHSRSNTNLVTGRR